MQRGDGRQRVVGSGGDYCGRDLSLAEWGDIVREHGLMAFQTAWRILGHEQDTEDAVQDALLEGLRAYRKGAVQNWGGFLRQAATCRALDRLRKRKTIEAVPVETLIAREFPADARAEQSELVTWLRSEVATLPAQQAEAFSLHYFGELSHAEIADALGIKVEGVAVALHKARATLTERGKLWQARIGRKDHG